MTSTKKKQATGKKDAKKRRARTPSVPEGSLEQPSGEAQLSVVKPRKVGRPTKYRESHIALAHELMSRGFTRERLAIELGISYFTLEAWEATYPEFAEAIRAGAELADSGMEMSLYQRGKGYEYEEVQMEAILDEKGKPVRRLRRQTTRHVPGDPRCQMFWLRNRQRERWSEGAESGATVGLFVANMTPEQRAERERIAALKRE